MSACYLSGMTKQTTVFLRDFTILALIGVYPHEKTEPQRVRFNIDIDLVNPDVNNDLEATIDYAKLADKIRDISRHHFDLSETMAEFLADHVMTDKKAQRVTVRIEKLDIMPGGIVGAAVTRSR